AFNSSFITPHSSLKLKRCRASRRWQRVSVKTFVRSSLRRVRSHTTRGRPHGDGGCHDGASSCGCVVSFVETSRKPCSGRVRYTRPFGKVSNHARTVPRA